MPKAARSRCKYCMPGATGTQPAVGGAVAAEITDYPFTPRELSVRGIERQIRSFVRCAVLAREGGYDGVEIMGSGLLHQRVSHQHQSSHRWVGWQL